MKEELKRKIIAVSGGCDPCHSGHIRMILEAATYGDVVVILNSDDWLLRKKGYKFMGWEERAEILMGIKGVVDVVPVDDSDGTVCEALRRIRPDYFANGGDRKPGNTPEGDVCAELGIEMVWNVGGGKTQSSSWLIDAVRSGEPKKL
jgi:D-beta-D-heptose 7-phosphate kinase/D-beta-D-heptose 1-phosphate adenosyltransferase